MIEVIKEIITVVSILIKFEREDILENQNLFIEFLNELGIKNKGRSFNKANFRHLMSSLTKEEKLKLIEEFNMGHQSTYRVIEMYSKN